MACPAFRSRGLPWWGEKASDLRGSQQEELRKDWGKTGKAKRDVPGHHTLRGDARLLYEECHERGMLRAWGKLGALTPVGRASAVMVNMVPSPMVRVLRAK